MSDRVLKTIPWLQQLLTATRSGRKRMYDNITLSQIRAIYELDYNYKLLVCEGAYLEHNRNELSKGIKSASKTSTFKRMLRKYDTDFYDFVKSCFPKIVSICEANCSQPE
jgi:hypothetical protein